MRKRGQGVINDLAEAIVNSPIQTVAATTKFSGERTVSLDLEQIFMLYATFCGDVHRAAHAAGVEVEQLEALVKQHKWDVRIKGLIELRKSDRAGDVERAMNRAICFVQAHRYRIFLERVLRDLTSRSEDELYNLLVTEKLDKNGDVKGCVLSMKPLSDLSAALEKVHYMTYLALADAPQDRSKRKEAADPNEGQAEVDVHARISKALAEMRAQDALAKAQAAPTAAAPPALGEAQPPI